MQLVQTEQTITAASDGFQWTISRQSGQIVTAGQPGRPVLIGGPLLMVLPTHDWPVTPGFPLTRPQSYTPLNTTCSDWKTTSVSATQSADGAEITVAGQYKEAAGSYTLRVAGGGDAEISYRFACRAPEKTAARQIGMVLFAPRSLDTLTWKRKAQWSVYPDDHIGRPEGTARALPDPSLVAKEGRWMEVAYREKPAWPWFADANELGTRDFRATRRNIWRASLQDSSGQAVPVLSDGVHQHTRAFLTGDRLGFLVAWFSGPGGVADWARGLNRIAGAEPMVVQDGMELKDRIRLSLARQGTP